MRTLQKWKESWECMPRTWFLKDSWWIHTQSLFLYENSKISPYSLSKSMIISNWNEQMGFYTILVLTELASRVNAFAMASWCFFTSGFFLRQLWGVLATLARLASILFAMGNSELCSLDLLAIHSPLRAFSPSTRRCELGVSDLWCSLPLLVFDSPSARHGELTFALFLCVSSLLHVLTFNFCTNG